MTKKKSIQFPATDSKFDVAFTELMAHLAAPDTSSTQPAVNTYTRWGLNVNTQYNPLLAILGNTTTTNTWLYVYPLEKHAATRTATLKAQKNTLKKKALVIIRAMRISLKAADKTVPGTLTDADKQFLFIPVPNPITNSNLLFKTASPVPVLSIQSVKHLEHHIDSHDPTTPKSTALPDGVQFIWIKRFIGTTAPTDQGQFTHLLFSGKFRNLSAFVSANASQHAWYTAAYISTTGDVGAWSPFVGATISQTN